MTTSSPSVDVVELAMRGVVRRGDRLAAAHAASTPGSERTSHAVRRASFRAFVPLVVRGSSKRADRRDPHLQPAAVRDPGGRGLQDPAPHRRDAGRARAGHVAARGRRSERARRAEHGLERDHRLRLRRRPPARDGRSAPPQPRAAWPRDRRRLTGSDRHRGPPRTRCRRRRDRLRFRARVDPGGGGQRRRQRPVGGPAQGARQRRATDLLPS